MQLSIESCHSLIASALGEDIGTGDITGASVIDEAAQARFAFVARTPMVVAGLALIAEVFSMIDPQVQVEVLADEGEEVEAGAQLAIVEGPARALLAGERTALNFIQRTCGVATLTQRYVEAVEGTGAQILDTRKTIPGWRLIDKYAVTCGGGVNHRIGLFDGVLIKDNHIAIAGSIARAVERAKADTPLLTKIEVECDTLAQVKEAVAAGVDMVLLDNMDIATLREGVSIARAAHVATEASGNVSLETVRAIAETGVDYISVGKLTHSASAVDIGLDVV